ncbi:uncharacterized protein (DUF305 family) [Prauserella shujinwangii]|uniref:Uncharacterized protein (DUF305 family) n=1 Tax=Prauserella shujinwangii TaxID=1453103 RepID=A0A2T0LLE4_9PSEU|nr:DUF305 domain-containing protein [Prauserella shujinwangii]PRX43863.1 uncharacterized protein (DUF305 family) [Prauserella shujinwangii]
MPRRKHIAGGALILTLGLAAGCGTSGDAEPAPSTGPAPATATSAPNGDDHNRSDVAFAQEMVPHHEQAVVAAELALERTADPAIQDLARRITSVQDPETKQLMALLTMWGETVTPGGASGEHDHSHLMTEETFQELQQATAAEFDELWLRTMIEHHQGAVEIAEAQLRDGNDSLASIHAREIADRQRQEVTEMTALLER